MSPGLPSVPLSGALAAPAAMCGPPFPHRTPDRLATALTRVVTGAGNRCGTTCRPALVRTPPQHAARPKILLQLQERVRAYFDDPKVPPSLNAANGSPRQQRSERRKPAWISLGALVHYLDLATLRVGIPQADGSTQGLSLAFLAERAGLGRRRAERACRDLRKAGLVTVYPRPEDRGRPLPEPAGHSAACPKPSSKSLVSANGFQHERDKAVKRYRRHRRRQDATATAADQAGAH